MKAFILLIAIAISIGQVQANNEIIVESTIDSVTVYQKGAEILRIAEVDLEKGLNTVVFTNLTELLNPKSIQLKGTGDYTIVSIKHEVEEKPSSEIPPIVKELEDSIKWIDEQLKLLGKMATIYEAERGVITRHRDMSHVKTGIRVETLAKGASMFRSRLDEITKLEIANDKQKSELEAKRKSIKNEIWELSYEEPFYYSEITVELDVPSNQQMKFELSYYVKEAQWTPSYDIKMKTIEHPLGFTFKAHISQQTGEDWTDVSLCVTTGKPDKNQTPKQLRKEIVDFEDAVKAVVIDSDASIYTLAGGPGEICGKVKDMEMEGEGLPFANVYVEVNGVPRGTSTDMDGFYSIKPLPAGNYTVTVDYIGYQTQKVTGILVTSDRAAFVDFEMREDAMMLDEVVVMSYQVPLIDSDRGSGLTLTGDDINRMPTRDVNSIVATAAGLNMGGGDVGGYRGNNYSNGSSSKAYQSDEGRGLNARGSRRDGTEYYIDGVKVRGNVGSLAPKKLKKRSLTQTSYLIEERYTINSDDNTTVVVVDEIDIDTYYQHYVLPAHERTAFLTANILNWEDYNFLDGPLNLFVEGKFTGKSFLEAEVVTDTLTISLGNDPNVIVERSQIKDYQSSNVFGNKKTDQFGYRINVRNNKQQTINLVIQDQVPISRVSSIVVKTEETDATEYNKEKGFLDWEYSLASGNGKSHEFKYSIKYPSKKRVVIR